jgi:uncharacterized protein YjbJ (UPF0337 family)
MDWYRIEGNWNELAGKARERWGILTDSEIQRVKGKRDELVGVLQQRYGYAKDRARDEVDRWAQSLETQTQTLNRVSSQVSQQGREVREGIAGVTDNLQSAINKSLRDQPMATVAMAAIVGFVLGAIWKS